MTFDLADPATAVLFNAAVLLAVAIAAAALFHHLAKRRQRADDAWRDMRETPSHVRDILHAMARSP